MTTTQFEINRPKQPNGLWGCGMEVQHIERPLIFDTEYKTILCSAISAMVCEKYPNRLFEIIWIDNSGFTVHFLDPPNYWTKPDKNKFTFYRFKFDNWVLIDNKLFQNLPRK